MTRLKLAPVTVVKLSTVAELRALNTSTIAGNPAEPAEAEGLVGPQVEDAHRRCAVGGDFLDAHGLRPSPGNVTLELRPHCRPLCTFQEPEKPISHGKM